MIYVDPVSALFLKQTGANKMLNNNPDLEGFSWPQAAEDPTWAMCLTKLLNPFYNTKEEDEKYKPVYEALFDKQMGNYEGAIGALQPKLTSLDDEEMAYRVLGNIYMEYAKLTKDKEPILSRKREDSAMIYYQQAEDLK